MWRAKKCKNCFYYMKVVNLLGEWDRCSKDPIELHHNGFVSLMYEDCEYKNPKNECKDWVPKKSFWFWILEKLRIIK